jgi:hypothetical protein
MSASSWLKSLKALGRKEPTVEDNAAIIAEMTADKSDRGAALIMATALQTSLKGLVRIKLVHLTETENEGLFGRDAPLSTFSALIRIAYAFGLIDAEIRRDLDRIREIRNVFAHAFVPVTFETPEIVHACDGLIAFKNRYRASGKQSVARVQYQSTVGRLIGLFLRTIESKFIKWPVHYNSLDD